MRRRLYLKLLKTVEAQGMTVVQPSTKPRKIELGSVELTLFPQPPEDRKEENNNSIGLRMSYGSFSVLFTGDSEETERAVVAAQRSEPGAELHDPASWPTTAAGTAPTRAGCKPFAPSWRWPAWGETTITATRTPRP